jgi:hypothetical protein
MKHRHDVAWVRLFGTERPGDWTDRTPPAPAVGTSSWPRRLTGPADLPRTAGLPGTVGLTSPAVLAPAAKPSHVDVAATSLGRAG